MKISAYLSVAVLALAGLLTTAAAAQDRDDAYRNNQWQNSNEYQQGYRDGMYDRDNNRGAHPEARDRDGRDHEAYEAGYRSGYSGQRGDNNWGRYSNTAWQGGYGNYGGRLNPHDQSVYDQLYNNYLEAQRINSSSQVQKAESAMQNVYRKYNIPSNTPYGAVASGGYNNGGYNGGGYNNNGYGNHGGWHNGGNNYAGRLNSHDQGVYDQLYANWLQARTINATSQVQKAESAMQTVYRKYNIPSNTPYGEVASGARR